jgi:hypothetical protein
MEIMKKGDDGRQHNRQSKDFKEIWSIQSEMKVKDFEWDKMFHNWETPENCNQNRHYKTCHICDMIKRKESIDHLRPKK